MLLLVRKESIGWASPFTPVPSTPIPAQLPRGSEKQPRSIPLLIPGIKEVPADLAIMEALAKITLILTPRDPLTPLEGAQGSLATRRSSGSWPEDALGSGMTKEPQR